MPLFKRKKETAFAESSAVIKDLRKIIPNYQGYENVEDRLETDKLFRSHIVAKLRNISNIFAEIVGKLIEMRMLNAWGVCDRALRELKEIEAKVREPDYKHTTFFDNPTLEGLDVSVLYLLESEAFALLEDMKVLTEDTLGRLREANFENIDQLVARLVQLANSLVQLLGDRIELIASFEIIGF